MRETTEKEDDHEHAQIGCSLTLTVWLLAAHAAPAQTDAEKERSALTKALAGAKVPLQQGLAASERQGRPISGKFELEHGHLQLSVYTEKGGKFPATA
jgi:hypothetical protein